MRSSCPSRSPLAVVLVITVLLAVASLSACFGRESGGQAPAPASEPAPAEATEPGQRLPAVHARARKVTIELRTGKVRRASAGLRRILARREGWVATAFERNDDSASASFDLRVPDDRLDAFRAEVRRLGEVTMDHEEVEDVGAEQADLAARLRTARQEEERLLALVAERTASLGDIVAVEARLGEVRERIERMDASTRLLADRVATARVHVDVLPRAVPYWQQPFETIAGAGRWGLQAVQAELVGIVAAVVGLGPTAVLGLGLLLALIAAVRAGARRLVSRARTE